MRVKVKRSGAIFIATTIFLGVAGANTANNLLYIIVSAMLSLMLVSGISSILNLKWVRIKLVPPREVFAKERASFRIVLWSEGVIPSFLIRVSSDVDSVLFLEVGKRLSEGSLDMVFENRGLVKKVRIRMSSDFPLGMFVRYIDLEIDTDFVVFPAPIPTEFTITASGEDYDRGDSVVSQGSVGYEDFKGIRDYRGDPMKLIHWKLSAKKGELLVKEMVEDSKKPVILSEDSVTGDIETRLSKLSYLVIKYIEEGYPVGIHIKNSNIPPRRGEKQKLLILRELALY